jgi:flagellar protein FlgJ
MPAPISLAYSGLALTDPAARASGAALRRGGDLDHKTLQKQAVEFESVYLAQMLEPMFEGIQAEAPFGGGFGEDVWRSLQIREFGKALSERGGIGLADAVGRQLLKMQEARGKTLR